MASVLKLKTDIKKLKAAIASKATSGAIKTKLRGKLTSLENELDKLQPNKRKPKTTGPKSESALVKLAKKRRTNQNLSTSKSDIERDAIRPAKKAGKRISASGNTYYEYRDNRIDNRQPPKKYRKLADGGNTSDFDKLIADKFKMNDELDYAEDLKDFILKKYKGKSVDGYELKYGTSDGGTPWVWVLTNKNIDLFAEPFVDSLDDGIIVEAYEDEDELINRHEIPFKLTGDFEKDAEKYIKLLKPYFKKYASGKYADGGKTQGYDDKKDESLGMTRGKLSLKDFVGNRKQKEHSRRDDARFEERGKMASGGVTIYKEVDLNRRDGKVKTSQVITLENYREALEKIEELERKNKNPNVKYYTGNIYREKGGYMADGGGIPNNYEGKDAAEVWNSWTKEQRLHFLEDHWDFYNRDRALHNFGRYYISSQNFNELPPIIVEMVTTHVFEGQYADGGSVAQGNYQMLMSQVKEAMHHAEELMNVVKPDMDIEAWVVSKAERATTDLSDITHYLDGLKMAMGGMVKGKAHKVNA